MKALKNTKKNFLDLRFEHGACAQEREHGLADPIVALFYDRFHYEIHIDDWIVIYKPVLSLLDD